MVGTVGLLPDPKGETTGSSLNGQEPSWMLLSGSGSELPGPLNLHECQPIRDYLSLLVNIPGFAHTANTHIKEHLPPQHTAQWTKLSMVASGTLGMELGKTGWEVGWWDD